MRNIKISKTETDLVTTNRDGLLKELKILLFFFFFFSKHRMLERTKRDLLSLAAVGLQNKF